MAQYDLKGDTTPQNANRAATGPTVAAFRTALAAYNSTSYTSARLDTMSKRDMRYAARLHGLTVAGL